MRTASLQWGQAYFGRGDEFQLVARLPADLHELMRRVVGADLLGICEIVEVLVDRQEVRQRASSALATRVSRDLDFLFQRFARSVVFLRRFELRLIEEVTLLGRDLLASRAEALRLKQSLPFFEKRDSLGLLVDRCLLIGNELLERFDRRRNVGARHARTLPNAKRSTTQIQKKVACAV
jgi:hypothetical protein